MGRDNATIDVIRIVSIFAVVVLHVSALHFQTSSVGAAEWWAGNVFDAAVRWSVPLFVMISGALLLSQDNGGSVWEFYRRRLRRVAIPLIAWTVIFLAYSDAQVMRAGANISAAANVKQLLAGKPYYHLWFLYMIVPLYLFTPFLRRLVQASLRIELWFLAASSFFIAGSCVLFRYYEGGSDGFFGAWFALYIPYFLSGYLLYSEKRLAKIPTLAIILVLGVTMITTGLGTYWFATRFGANTTPYFFDYLSITVIPMSLAAFALFLRMETLRLDSHKLRRVANLTLGIYLVHPLFLGRFGLIVKGLPLAASIPVEALLVFCVSALVALVLSQIAYVRRII